MEAAAILSAAMLVLTGCAIGGSLKQFNVSDTKFTVSTNDGWMTEINDDNTGFTLEKEGDEVEVQFIDKDSMDIDSLRTVYEQAAETGLFDDADFEMDDNGNAVLTLELSNADGNELTQQVIWFEDADAGALLNAEEDAAQGLDHISFKVNKAKGEKLSYKKELKDLCEDLQDLMDEAENGIRQDDQEETEDEVSDSSETSASSVSAVSEPVEEADMEEETGEKEQINFEDPSDGNGQTAQTAPAEQPSGSYINFNEMNFY